MKKGFGSKRLLDQISEGSVALTRVSTYAFLWLPLIMVVITSFDSRDFLYFPPAGFSLKWYVSFLNYPTFMEGFRNSIILTSCTISVGLAIGIPSSLAIVRHQFRGKELLNTLILSPLIIPGVVIGSSLLYFFVSIGLIQSFPKLVIAHVIITFPYVLRTCSACLIGMDRSIEEAAMNLGANEYQTFMKITLPLMKPGVIAGAVFAFIVSFDDVATTAFLTDAYTYTFPIALVGYMRQFFDPLIAAASAFLILLTVVMLLVIEKAMGIHKFIGLR